MFKKKNLQTRIKSVFSSRMEFFFVKKNIKIIIDPKPNDPTYRQVTSTFNGGGFWIFGSRVCMPVQI